MKLSVSVFVVWGGRAGGSPWFGAGASRVHTRLRWREGNFVHDLSFLVLAVTLANVEPMDIAVANFQPLAGACVCDWGSSGRWF